jgi:hypothetical protein
LAINVMTMAMKTTRTNLLPCLTAVDESGEECGAKHQPKGRVASV